MLEIPELFSCLTIIEDIIRRRLESEDTTKDIILPLTADTIRDDILQRSALEDEIDNFSIDVVNTGDSFRDAIQPDVASIQSSWEAAYDVFEDNVMLKVGELGDEIGDNIREIVAIDIVKSNQ